MNRTIRTLAAAVLAFALVGCGTKDAGSTAESGKKEDKVIRVGATSVPHAEILNEAVASIVEKDGWKLEVTEFTDYVTPNTSLEDGSLDANYFQTLGYMQDQNKSNGLHLAAVGGVHIEPMGIYSESLKALDELKDGAAISLPNDKDNLDRALRFLVQQGLLEDPKTEEYVTETTFNGNKELNPHGYELQPVEAAQVSRTLSDVDAAVINGNYALEAGLPSKTPALVIEEFDTEASIARTNFIVVKQGSEDSEKTKELVKAVSSEEVKKYIEDTYKGAVIPSFIDENGKALN